MNICLDTRYSLTTGVHLESSQVFPVLVSSSAYFIFKLLAFKNRYLLRSDPDNDPQEHHYKDYPPVEPRLYTSVFV